MLEAIFDLSEKIRREYPRSVPKYREFDSGAADLEVTVDGDIWVMEYLPKLRAFGVSRMRTATFGWEGVENHFNDFSSAKEFLLSLLRNT